MTDPSENIQTRIGLFENVPRFVRTMIANRMRALESDAQAFDREALYSRQRLKRLYALLHLPSGERAQQTLFGKIPGDSLLGQLARLGRTKDNALAARLMREGTVSLVALESAMGSIAPEVALAFVETAPAEELLGRLRALSRRDVLQGAVREALLRRVKALAKDPPRGLDYRHVRTVIELAELDDAVARALLAWLPTAETSVARTSEAVRLTGATALVVDTSSSMMRDGQCLALATSAACALDRALDPDQRLAVVLFGEEAVALEVPRGSSPGRWKSSLSVASNALGTGTAAGAAMEYLSGHEAPVERVVIVTDGLENRAPRLVDGLRSYRNKTGHRPTVCLVQPAGTPAQLASDLRRASEAFIHFPVDTSFLGIAALAGTLATPALETQDLLAQIDAFALP